MMGGTQCTRLSGMATKVKVMQGWCPSSFPPKFPAGGHVAAGTAAPRLSAGDAPAEALETTCIHRVAGRTNDRAALVTTRPCRAPHHPISDVGLIGGGHVPMPGDVSLAHHGVLFLDAWPEFRRHVLEVLRQPLEDGAVTIARA
jgi:magnesium chelatase family protein